MIHHFAKLGLTPQADTDEIKASYRRLVKQFHPDMPGGNAVYFAQIKTAYDALSDEGRRAKFLRTYSGWRKWRAKPAARPVKTKAQPGRQQSKAKPGAQNRGQGQPHNQARSQGQARSQARSQAQGRPQNGTRPNFRGRATHGAPPVEPTITRVMSIAIARSGSLVLENLYGKIIIDATTPFTMWETTLAKFGRKEKQRLARHVIQVKVTGEADLVRRIRVRATEFGVALKPDGVTAFSSGKGATWTDGFSEPLVLRCTIPTGTPIHLRNTHGSIIIGDLDNELRATLDGDTKLRAGSLSHASLIMKGASMAFLARVNGTVDTLLSGTGKVLLDGELKVLRAVVEQESVVEVVGAVQRLQADVMGNGFLHAKHTVFAANCEAHENGYVRIAELKSYLVGNRSGRGRIDVLKKPMFVPVNGHRARKTAGRS